MLYSIAYIIRKKRVLQTAAIGFRMWLKNNNAGTRTVQLVTLTKRE